MDIKILNHGLAIFFKQYTATIGQCVYPEENQQCLSYQGRHCYEFKT